MKEQEVQDTLDLFDMQFAKGEINQSTYSELTKKWQEKLQALKGGVVVVSGGAYTPPSSTPAPPKVESLECPKCHAPMKNLEQDLSKPIRCNSCGDTYTLRQSQDETQRLLQEAKIWFEQRMVSRGAGGSNSIDMNARRFIFNENLFPELKRDIDRRLGTLEDAPKAPLFPLTVMPGFQDYRPNSDLVSIGQGNNQWLKTLSTRVSAQELQVFATIEADRERLKALEFRVHTLIYYANIARFLESTGAPSYQLVQHNLQELQKECRAYAQEVADESYRSYLLALDSRISGALLLLDVLMPVLEQGRSFAPGAAIAQLDRALAQYTKAAQQAAACTYTPLYSVPLQQGIQKDMMLAQVFYAIVKCYGVVLHTHPVEFGAFYNHLVQYTRSLVVVQSPDQLLGLVQSIGRLLGARSGDAPVPVIVDWSWLDAAIQANVRKATFGAAETPGMVLPHFHPYWVATLNYAEKQGIIFKSGMGREALILVDATSVGAPVVGYLLANDPLLPVVSSGLHNYNLLDKQYMALPALLSRDMAEQAMKQFTGQRAAELGATIVKMIDLIYLPVAFVRYNGKNQTREILIGRLNFVNQNLKNALTQTHQFLQQYGA